MTEDEKAKCRSNAYALAYAQALPYLTELARRHGYALAVHGSMCRDFDLIAVPWTNEAAAPEVLEQALREAVQPDMGGPYDWVPAPFTEREHGRLSTVIHLRQGGGSPYIDLSVMPRKVPDLR